MDLRDAFDRNLVDVPLGIEAVVADDTYTLFTSRRMPQSARSATAARNACSVISDSANWT
jgi:hypothetical protein